MKAKDPKKVVQDIVALVGQPAARQLLVGEGISTSVADKLSRNQYPSRVGLLVGAAIARAAEAAKSRAS